MQQDKIFKRGWMVIGSAVVGTIMCLMMIGVFIYTIYVYINSGEINNYIEEGTNMADIWREIAEKYKDEPVIWGYDLLNEPREENYIYTPDGGLDWNRLAEKIAKAIREVDPSRKAKRS